MELNFNNRLVVQGGLLYDIIGLPVIDPLVPIRIRILKIGLSRITGLTVAQIDYRMAAYKKKMTATVSDEHYVVLARRKELLKRTSMSSWRVRMGSMSLKDLSKMICPINLGSRRVL